MTSTSAIYPSNVIGNQVTNHTMNNQSLLYPDQTGGQHIRGSSNPNLMPNKQTQFPFWYRVIKTGGLYVYTKPHADSQVRYHFCFSIFLYLGDTNVNFTSLN